ncbi:MAG: RluA family pseudouridine synthase [Planctomycetes bacterium]|nr:RluA family pseudouridine synthase [Planctomycetota bacterium]
MSSDDPADRDAPACAEQITYRVDPVDRGQRLDSFLVRRMHWRSRTSIQKLIQDGKVQIVRRAARAALHKPAAVLVDGDTVHVTLPKPKRDIDFAASAEGAIQELPILFEDRWLVAVDKPPNVPVHPAGRNLHRTVITLLRQRYARADDPGAAVQPKLCHRLDLETSGVLLVAKEDQAHRRVSEMFRRRLPEKEYLAIVHGVPREKSGLIDLPLGPALGMTVAMARGVRHDIGQKAETRWEVISRSGGFALLRIGLLTGRHHQIRVHLAAIGHPLVGDKIYGGDEELFIRYYDGALTAADQARLLLPRQALHAHRLELTHPMTGAPLVLVSPLPEDLAAFLRAREEGS